MATGRWRREAAGQVVHDDSDEHVSLLTRTLGIDEAAWAATLDRYASNVTGASSVPARLQALGEAFRPSAPFRENVPELPKSSCACCSTSPLVPVVARRSGQTTLVYGRCDTCGHGQLLAGETRNPYEAASYYQQRSGDGSGYQAYAAERQYREQKGERLMTRLLAHRPAPRSLLEVGSGFGYTLQAAERQGLEVAGVDLNPEAERAARELYGLSTQVSTLAQALDARALPTAAWDVVLYQFVLEHVRDVQAELSEAARALSTQGRLVLVVPSMESFELEVFGASYRSLRGDHLHLFSRASLQRLLDAAGLQLLELESHCNSHLLRGFLSQAELHELYGAGRGPDFTAVATRRAS